MLIRKKVCVIAIYFRGKSSLCKISCLRQLATFILEHKSKAFKRTYVDSVSLVKYNSDTITEVMFECFCEAKSSITLTCMRYVFFKFSDQHPVLCNVSV